MEDSKTEDSRINFASEGFKGKEGPVLETNGRYKKYFEKEIIDFEFFQERYIYPFNQRNRVMSVKYNAESGTQNSKCNPLISYNGGGRGGGYIHMKEPKCIYIEQGGYLTRGDDDDDKTRPDDSEYLIGRLTTQFAISTQKNKKSELIDHGVSYNGVPSIAIFSRSGLVNLGL